MSSSINRMMLSMQSRHLRLRFRKIQKLGMLHVGSPSFHLTGVAASDKPKKLLNMPDLLAESVGSVFSCFFLSWPLLALWLGSLSGRSRWLIIWTLEISGIGLRFGPLYDLRLYLAGLLYACAIYCIRVIHMGLHTPLLIFLQIGCWVHLWNKVGQSGVVGASCCLRTSRTERHHPSQRFHLPCLLNSQPTVAKAALSRLSTQSMPLIWPLSNRTQKMCFSSCLTSLVSDNLRRETIIALL